MAFKDNKILSVLASLLVVVLLNLLQPFAVKSSSSKVPCFFIFGDSLVDNGNNNQLNTTVKANYPPYGIDFPLGPTGRFNNGRTTVDFIAEFLGFKNFIPSFATVHGQDIIKGVNFASGGAGIRDETAQHLGEIINLYRQLLNHNLTITRIARSLGNDNSAEEYVNKCLYMFVIGTNDYLNNYYLPMYYSTSQEYTPEEYAAVLTQQYSHQLKTVYNYGARKIGVTGLGTIGCIAARGATNGSSPCVDSINKAAHLFNDKLKHLVDDFNANLTDAKFVYISPISGNPNEPFALPVLGEPCCKVAETGLCIPGETPCPDRDAHVLYDDYHPTEIVHKAMADAAYVEIKKLIYGYRNNVMKF